jgi:SAM-dependent methyltransferase
VTGGTLNLSAGKVQHSVGEILSNRVYLCRLDAERETVVRTIQPKLWGDFLRYKYYTADFSDVTEPGLYYVRIGTRACSEVFRIADNVYDRGVWQPVIEYFLPVQMCHMRVAEKYRVWHDYCHMDDALMAKAGNHIDGYDQKPGLSKYAELQPVPGVNVGGWHDAGDFDLRIESQAGEAYILALAYELFHPEIDVTAIDQPSDTYDVVICNHVLEHVSDANKAFSEIKRILKPGGWAILLVPINPDVDTFEDPSITDPKERERLFGQYDHVRQFGRDYAEVLRKAGFKVTEDRIYYEISEEQRERMHLARRGEEIIYRCSLS